jgi:hypothetical protein
MKKLMIKIIFIACALSMIGWATNYDEHQDKDSRRAFKNDEGHADRDNGFKNADRSHQANDEDRKRSDGDENGLKSIQNNKNHQFE